MGVDFHLLDLDSWEFKLLGMGRRRPVPVGDQGRAIHVLRDRVEKSGSGSTGISTRGQDPGLLCAGYVTAKRVNLLDVQCPPLQSKENARRFICLLWYDVSRAHSPLEVLSVSTTHTYTHTHPPHTLKNIIQYKRKKFSKVVWAECSLLDGPWVPRWGNEAPWMACATQLDDKAQSDPKNAVDSFWYRFPSWLPNWNRLPVRSDGALWNRTNSEVVVRDRPLLDSILVATGKKLEISLVTTGTLKPQFCQTLLY